MYRNPIIICCIAAMASIAAAEGGPPGHEGGQPGQRPGPNPMELFKQADANGDGKVTLAEFTAFMEKRRTDERGKLFDLMDTDHDGKLSKEEFLKEPPPPKGQEDKRPPRPDGSEIFKRLDRNGDGVVTVEELQAGREQREERREDRREERRDGEHRPEKSDKSDKPEKKKDPFDP